jgi:hypothetical protein
MFINTAPLFESKAETLQMMTRYMFERRRTMNAQELEDHTKMYKIVEQLPEGAFEESFVKFRVFTFEEMILKFKFRSMLHILQEHFNNESVMDKVRGERQLDRLKSRFAHALIEHDIWPIYINLLTERVEYE